MSLILPMLAAFAALSLITSTLVGLYSVWQCRRPTESVFARNARLDREAAELQEAQPGMAHPALSGLGVRKSA